ncbi:MAG: hypothetical protein ACI4NV_09215 [Thermoguttaceae bacterium]
MLVHIIQKNGVKTPVEIELLERLAREGRLDPDVILEIDGERLEAWRFKPLEEIFRERNALPEPRVAIPAPPRADLPPEELPVPQKAPAVAAEDPLEVVAASRVDSVFDRADKKERVALNRLAAVGSALFLVAVVFKIVAAAIGLAPVAEIFDACVSLLFFFLAIVLYRAARAIVRANAILRETQTLRASVHEEDDSEDASDSDDANRS